MTGEALLPFACSHTGGVQIGGAHLTLGTVVAALAAANAQNRTSSRIGGDDTRVLESLVGWLRRLVAADDPTGAGALARLEETPESHPHLHELAQILNRRATSDTGFRSELEALISQARSESVDIGSITRQAWGNQVQPPL